MTIPLILDAQKEGVKITLSSSGGLKISGQPDAVKKWTPIFANRKDEVMTALGERAAVWRVRLPDREVLAHNVPPATRAHMMRLYPMALSVEVEDMAA
jgi:hypothetical protein